MRPGGTRHTSHCGHATSDARSAHRHGAPGLQSAGAVWDTTVAHYKERYECHVLTLAGFAGQPALPAGTPFLKTVRDGERCWFVRLTDIARFESHGNDTRLYFSGQRPLILRSLAYLEARLDPQLFFRASRRHIVNLSAGAHMEPAVDGGYELTLTSGPAVSMSRHRAQEFRDRMLI